MDWVYNVPTKFYEYSLDEMKNRLLEFNENVLVIGSKRVITSFDLDVNKYQVLNKSIANPDIQLVEQVLNTISKPDLIIAIGGGSSIDLAKAISSLYDYKNNNILDLLKNKAKPLYQRATFQIHVLPMVHTEYVARILKAPFTRQYYMSRASGSSGSMPKINQDTVSNTLIPLPPLAEQKRIVAKLEELLAVCER